MRYISTIRLEPLNYDPELPLHHAEQRRAERLDFFPGTPSPQRRTSGIATFLELLLR